MSDSEEARHRQRRGIYLLPNLFTTAALFAGFYAIVAATRDDFAAAAAAIFVAMILDGLDGRVARLTNTQSDFGVQYDSLSDMVAFGLAPALVMYEWSLGSIGKFGWLAAFLYAAAGACGWRASTPRRRPWTAATFRDWPRRPPRRWSQAWYGSAPATNSPAAI